MHGVHVLHTSDLGLSLGSLRMGRNGGYALLAGEKLLVGDRHVETILGPTAIKLYHPFAMILIIANYKVNMKV